MSEHEPQIVTVSLNPAVDCVFETPAPDAPASRHRLLHRIPAGKGVNISRVLAAFDIPSLAAGVIGRDNRGLYDELFDGGLVRDGFLALPGKTRENRTVLLAGGGEQSHDRRPGLPVRRADLLELQSQLAATLYPEDLVVFSGSLPPGVSAGDFADLLQTVAACGARVAVDTSGPGLDALKKGTFRVLAPNVAELAGLAGRDIPDTDALCTAARGLVQKAAFVLVSAGEDGAFLFSGRTHWHAVVAAADCPRPRNTVGAGDVLLAVFIAALDEGRDPPDCLATAVAAATASTATDAPAAVDWPLFETLQHAVLLESTE